MSTKTMNRRHLLKMVGQSAPSLCLLGGCSAVPYQEKEQLNVLEEDSASSELPTDDDNPENPEDTGTPEDPFALADDGPLLEDRLPRSILESSKESQAFDLQLISGHIPTDLEGYVFFVHPVPFEDGSPVVVGEGMLNRLDLGAQPKLHREVLKPPCYDLDQATSLDDRGFENTGLARISWTLGSRNLLNTALLPMKDRLLVTSDACRPWQVDPSTLQLVTPIGYQDEWTPAIPSWIDGFMHWTFPIMMTSAHPVIDTNTGEMFTANWGMKLANMTGFLDLVSWDGQSELVHYRLKDGWLDAKIEQSVHQIAVTSHHVIIMDTAFMNEMEDMFGGNGMKNQASESILWIINRSDLSPGGGDVQAKRVTIPREAAHFLADYDSSSGVLVLHVGHQCASDSSEVLEEGNICSTTSLEVDSELLGMLSASTDIGALGRYSIDATSGQLISQKYIHDERLWGGPALYTFNGNHPPDQFKHIWWLSFGLAHELRLKRIDEAYEDYPYRHTAIQDLPTTGQPPCLIHVDATDLTILDEYFFPQGRWASTPTFVEKTNASSETDGYIICTVISDDSSRLSGDEIWIFDASNLQQGPVARLGHQHLNMPLTLHSCYLKELYTTQPTYRVDIETDMAERISHLDSDLRDVFYQQTLPRFNS